MDLERTRARSRARAALALKLLCGAGISGGSLLEAGAGPGFALEEFRGAGFEISGLEASPAAAARARERGLRVEVHDLEREALPGGKHRVVAALEMLEHVRDPLALLRALIGALEPGGRIIVSLPNEFHLLRRLAILAGAPGALAGRPFGGHRDPHLHHFTPRLARDLFEAAGLRLEASAFDGLAPPRWRPLRGISGLLAAICPSLFAISGVYLLSA